VVVSLKIRNTQLIVRKLYLLSKSAPLKLRPNGAIQIYYYYYYYYYYYFQDFL